MALGDFLDLMLTVTVEHRPLYCRRTFRAPVMVNLSVMVTNNQISLLEWGWETNDEGTNLAGGVRSVDVSSKKARWA